METSYLGTVPFATALEAQAAAVERLRAGGPGTLIGFESEPTITLGLRARADDVVADVLARGLATVRVDRGGQATLHNPGQLVIFPVCAIGAHGARGARAWVEALVRCTRDVAAACGHDLHWDERAPGLYDADGGKVAAIGLRIRRGISTHGIAVNVRNDLDEFRLIRACGRLDQPVAHLRTDLAPVDVFGLWAQRFTRTKTRELDPGR